MEDGPSWCPTISNCDQYLNARTGKYEWRRVRYAAALKAMQITSGLSDEDTLIDFGAGWTELDYCLRTEGNWRGRYIPLDGGIDGEDLNNWHPRREVDWIVALEIVEHLSDPLVVIERMKRFVRKGVIISTPNCDTVDVLGMDDTHVSIVTKKQLQEAKFVVWERAFYGTKNDSLFALYRPEHEYCPMVERTGA